MSNPLPTNNDTHMKTFHDLDAPLSVKNRKHTVDKNRNDQHRCKYETIIAHHSFFAKTFYLGHTWMCHIIVEMKNLVPQLLVKMTFFFSGVNQTLY